MIGHLLLAALLPAAQTALNESWLESGIASNENRVVTNEGQGPAVHETEMKSGPGVLSAERGDQSAEIGKRGDHQVAKRGGHAAETGRRGGHTVEIGRRGGHTAESGRRGGHTVENARRRRGQEVQTGTMSITAPPATNTVTKRTNTGMRRGGRRVSPTNTSTETEIINGGLG